MCSDDEVLQQLGEDFASELTELVRATVGPETAPFVAVPVSGAGQVRIRQEPAEGVRLKLAEDSTLVVGARFVARLNDSNQYLKIRKSIFEVSYAEVGGEPMFRYEYDAAMTRNLPHAHLQVSESQNLAALSAMASDGSRMARRREVKVDQGRHIHRAADFHFPVGGDRFRPAFEDVLEFLIEQLGADAQPEYRNAIRLSRRTWRRRQLAAAVTDNPAAAAQTLTKLGYEISPPPSGHPPERADRLESI